MAAATSPRLPSPPPLTEVQFGPGSDESAGQLRHASKDEQGDDSGVTRRVRPGSRALDMAAGPPLVPLAQLDSPFQLQEHLKALHSHYTRPEGSETVTPINRDVAVQLAEPPEGVDRALWLYELCRFLTMKLNNLIVAFFTENPPCSSQTCPEMQASEWQYLCAVHDPPKTCCAIDYCCHTLDWATNILTSPKHFPSRLTLGSEASGGPQASMRSLVNIFRRLYRIFAHAWFKHRQVFWQVEGNEGLYIFFKTVCDVYHLMPEDSYTVPPEAEGIVSQPSSAAKTESPEDKPAANPRMSILKRSGDENSLHSSSIENLNEPGATTRRHKHSPSTGSRVTTITEDSEETTGNATGGSGTDEDAVVKEKTESTEEEEEPIPEEPQDDEPGLQTADQENIFRPITETVLGIQPSEVNGEGNLIVPEEPSLSESTPEPTEPEPKTEAEDEPKEQPKKPESKEPEESEELEQPEQPEQPEPEPEQPEPEKPESESKPAGVES